jgi:hypothetical protein
MLVFMSVLARALKGTVSPNQDGAENSHDAQKRSDDQTIFEVLCRLQERDEYKYFRETEISNLIVSSDLALISHPLANP